MSDPLKKEEIEDVLSSIRRLVSEDVRTMAAPEAVTPEKNPEQANAEKLVLTASLRVPEATPAEDEEAIDAEALIAQEIQKQASVDVSEGPRVLDLTTAAQDLSTSYEASETSPVGDTPAQETADNDWEAQDTDVEPEWQSVRSYRDMEFDPEAAGDGEYAGTEVETLEWSDASEATPIETIEEFTSAAPSEEPAAEQLIEAQAYEPEATEASVEEAVLDEEMLRDLVGEIVRQELQGPLGERITRNVRKLVRREINRALAARQIE